MKSLRSSLADMKHMSIDDKKSQLYITICSFTLSADWRDIIEHILKTEEEQSQYSLIQYATEVMMEADGATYQRAVDHKCINNLEYCKSLRCYFYILSSILCYSTLSSSYTIGTSIAATIKKFGLLQKEIMGQTHYQRPIDKMPEIIQETVTQCIKSVPEIILKARDCFQTKDLFAMFLWIAVFPVKTQQNLYQLDNFCDKVVNELLVKRNKDTIFGQILFEIFKTCMLSFSGSQNLVLMIEHISQSQILEGIKSIRLQLSTHYRPEEWLKIFDTLNRASVAPKTLNMIRYLSEMFLEQKMYPALRLVYTDFIVQKIILGALKFTTMAQEEIRDLCKMYVQGLAHAANTTIDRLSNVIADLGLRDDNFIDFWARLISIIVYPHKQQTNAIGETLRTFRTTKATADQLISENEYHRLRDGFWLPTQKLTEQNKLFLVRKSSLSGIKEISHGHIVSIMYLLYMSNHFYQYLLKYEQIYTDSSARTDKSIIVKSKIFYQLKLLFESLQYPKGQRSIDKVLVAGPHEFQTVTVAKDCVRYLQKLLDLLRHQLKSLVGGDQALNELNRLFQSTLERTVQCMFCKKVSSSFTYEYIQSVPGVDFVPQWTENNEFLCRDCNRMNSNQLLRNQIKNFGQILLIKLQRFDTNKNITVKNMRHGKLPRRLENHFLAGFICHVGTEMSADYILFYRKEENLSKWYRFNGPEVDTFETTHQNEEFEGRLEGDCTPYLLIYQRYD